jgi:cyanophycin synthetase
MLSRAIHAVSRGFAIQLYVHRLGVPIIGITGTNGKTTTARLLDIILREAGYRTGVSCTDGVMRDGLWVARDDLAGMGGVWLSAKGGGVDALIAETARGGMIRFGFAFRTCNVAAVTNVSDDHLGIDGINNVDEMAEVKARLLQRLAPGGTAVLNADDPRVAAMADNVRGPVIWFSMTKAAVEGKQAIYLDNGIIYRRLEGKVAALIPAEKVAISRVRLLDYNLCNAMTVLAILSAIRPVLPVSDSVAMRILRNEDPEQWPHAFRLLDYRGIHVLMSNSKNPLGFSHDLVSLSRVRKSLGCDKVVGLITFVGNRRNSFYRETVGLAAQCCDQLMVVAPSDAYLRGKSGKSLVSELEACVPSAKQIPSMPGDCADIILNISENVPPRTLFAILNSRQQRGTEKILNEAQEIDLTCS